MEKRVNSDLVLNNFITARQEVERFASDIRSATGISGDRPPLYCSAVPDEAATARDASGFRDCTVMVVSIGGSYTHFRCLEIAAGRVRERTDIASSLLHEGHEQKIRTPCADGKKHSLAEMYSLIASRVLPWLQTLLAEDTIPYILFNWGFPQQSVQLEDGSRLTGAIGQNMTKSHSGVQAEGKSIHDEFRACLVEQARRQKLDTRHISCLQTIKIIVQNDTIMSVFRYLEKKRRQEYREIALMILGTGVNLTSAEPYAVNAQGELLRDAHGVPRRLTRSQAVAESTSWKKFWVNYEVGRLLPAETRSAIDRIGSNEDLAEDIENFGAAGTGYGRVFKNLIFETLDEPQSVWTSICSVVQAQRPDKQAPGGEWVIQLAGGHDQKSPFELLPLLAERGLHEHILERLQYLAGIVIQRSAFRAAEILAAVSLYNGFGLQAGGKPDALAMEGSLWKTIHFQEKVREYWNALLAPELGKAGMPGVHVELIVEDGYNAGVLGPAYMLGQFL
ncbi:MAG TPA: hypothetical protein PKL83_00335 [bacterium]|nr:hypothetical protein [bacterium]